MVAVVFSYDEATALVGAARLGRPYYARAASAVALRDAIDRVEDSLGATVVHIIDRKEA